MKMFVSYNGSRSDEANMSYVLGVREGRVLWRAGEGDGGGKMEEWAGRNEVHYLKRK